MVSKHEIMIIESFLKAVESLRFLNVAFNIKYDILDIL